MLNIASAQSRDRVCKAITRILDFNRNHLPVTDAKQRSRWLCISVPAAELGSVSRSPNAKRAKSPVLPQPVEVLIGFWISQNHRETVDLETKGAVAVAHTMRIVPGASHRTRTGSANPFLDNKVNPPVPIVLSNATILIRIR